MKKYITTEKPVPWGSWGAASLKQKVYNYIKTTGPTGANRQEVAQHTNLNVGRVSSYLAELKRDGLVKRLGDAIDPASLTPEESALYALGAMENALVARFTKLGKVPTEVERAFVRYSKIKSLYLGAKTDGEEASALRMALIDLVKLVF